MPLTDRSAKSFNSNTMAPKIAGIDIINEYFTANLRLIRKIGRAVKSAEQTCCDRCSAAG